MPRAVSRLPWCSYMLGRARWRAVIVPRIIDPHDGRELAGICHFGRRLIEVAAWQSDAEMRRTMLHEMMHSAGCATSTEQHDGEAEERAVLAMERGLYTIITQFGFALPPLPDGLEEMRARVRDAGGVPT